MTVTGSTADLVRKIRSLPLKQQRVLTALLRERGVELSSLGAATTPRTTAPGEPVELSFAQQRLWFLAKLDGTSAYYNIPMALRLRGRLDRDVLRRAVAAIVARHEALRTRFVERDGVPYQHIGDAAGFAMTEEELTDPAELPAVCAGEAITPFDLERDLLIRVRLLRLAADEHVLLVTMHHSVSDGWSVNVFFRELVAHYEAEAAGRPAELPPLPVQYADYALWQRRWLGDQVQSRQLDYWRDQLGGVNPNVSLPTDRPRPPVRTYDGAHERFTLPADLVARLRAVSEANDVTLYMTLLALYAVLLGRYTNQTDLTIGTPVAGRNRYEVENLIGFFVNTLVIRADLAGDPTLPALLARVKQTALRAYEHQDVPFEAVVDALRVERSQSRSPLFQAMFALQEAQTERDVRLGELAVSLVEFDFNVTKFDLTLDLRETPDGMVGAVEYNTGLYDRATIQRFVRHYTTLLAAAVAEPAARIGALTVLDDAERDRVLGGWNVVSPVGAGLVGGVHEWFERVVVEDADRVAVVCEGRVLRYGELNERANRLAHYLRGLGVGPDDLVGLCLPRSELIVVGVLAVLKAGGGYVPLDPAYPLERLGYLVGESAPKVVLVDGAFPEGLAAAGVPVLDVRRDAHRWAGSPVGDPVPLAAGHHLAYVIYTSGSSGEPKGVLVEHRNVTRLFTATQPWFGFGPDDVWTLFHSFAFDFSVWEIWGALLYGGRVVVVPQAITRDPRAFYRLLCSAGVSVLNQTPSAFRGLIAAQGDDAPAHRLRVVIFGGEALDPAALKPWLRRPINRATELVNMYGITETTVHVTYRPLTAADLDAGASPIGRRIPDLRLYVLDQWRRPAPIGAVGELYVGGAGLARGYLNRRQLTEQRFLPDPFSTEPGARIYRTGDLVRYLPDGQLDYLGRIDGQIQLRGFRIEPGEIETQLRRHPAITDARVVAHHYDNDDQRLIAYIVPEPQGADANSAGPAVDLAGDLAGELGRHLRRILPGYMVPSAFVVIDEVPVTANGKLDRVALPAPEIDAYQRREHVAPRTATERELVAICADLLGFAAEQVSIGDNFFALGGHSLLITVLVARLQQRGLDVAVRTVFDAPTLADLAAAIDTDAGTPGSGYQVPPNRIPAGCDRITPDMLALVTLDEAQLAAVVATVPGGAANVQDIYPLVPCQEGILFHHLISPDNDPYVIPILLEASDQPACDRFVAALRAVLARHDVMRTAVVTADLPDPVQVVYRTAELDVVELALDPGRDAEEQARELLERPGRMRVDRAPLLQLEIAADPHSHRRFLLLRAHHLIEDATSLRLILAELIAHLSGWTDRLATPAPYRDFVGHTLHHIATGDAEAFFRDLLGDVTATTAPFGLTDVRGDGRRVAELRRSLPAELTDDLRQHARRLRTSPATLLHAAWAVLVATCSSRDDVVFGTVLSGRLQGIPGVESMLGNFINTLPMRVRLAGRTVADLVIEVDELLRRLVRHEQASLIMAQRCSGVPTDVPLFTSMINVRHFEPARDGTDDAGTQGIRWLGSVDRTNYPVGLSVDDTGAELSVNAQVHPSITPDALIDLLQTALTGIVAALAADDGTGTRALDLDLVPPALRHRLLVEWNDTGAPYPAGACLFELFDEQVRARPDAIAVEFGDQRLTYAQLDARADRVASYLRGRGAGPDVLVGLCAPRSLELVVGVLGILKAGGAYVPIDPGYPPDRVAALVRQSGVRIVLSRSDLPSGLLEGVDEVLHLDTGRRATDGVPALADRPPTALTRAELGLTPDHLAYVIFTSGSTGVPKGVLVEQRGVVRLVRNPDYFPSDERTVMLAHTSISFDVGAQEVLGPLLNGGRLVLLNGEGKDVDQLVGCVERTGVTHMCLTAGLLPAFTEAAEGRRLPLTYLGVGGEAFSAQLVRRLHRSQPRLTVVNCYGPTENSIASTRHVISRDLARDTTIPIGTPIAGCTAHVTDADLRLVPVGVVGELCVGGAGVARGYLGNPALTAARFVPDPFSAVPGARLYRTGDLVRRLADGALEFAGRVDDQVKIRGFRVEPGEVETALSGHPAVAGAVVTAQSSGESRRLVAYVCPTARWLDDDARRRNAERLAQWQRLFDDQYDAGAQAGDVLNLVGWNSSYTGQPIPEADMREWIEGTVRRIEALRPRRLLEVGCGTGLLLFRYAGGCESVHALDISASALAGVRRGMARHGWSHVTLQQGDALAVAGLAGRTFDTVVVNSVVQYFPNRVYLEEFLTRLLPLMADGGRILVGDVRNLDLFDAHLTAVERGTGTGRVTAGTLAARVHRRRQLETELLVSPAWFARLADRFPTVGAVDILVKRGTGDNEMLDYRYDVVLTTCAAGATVPLPWLPAGSVAEVRALLEGGEHDRFGVAGLPNPRINDDVAVSADLARWPAARPVEALPGGRRNRDAGSVRALEELLRYAERLGYRAEATWSQDQPDALDLLFGRGELPRVLARDPYRATRLANTPQIADTGATLSALLREHLAGVLPEYLVPSVFLALESLPLNANGKVDRTALPAPTGDDVRTEAYLAPGTELERTLCRLIADVLELDRVGLRDTFFGLGGHSLLATRLTIRARQETGLELPLPEILAGATVERLAAVMAGGADARPAGTPPLVPLPDGADAPLSLQQEELWFRTRPAHAGASYDNVQSAFRILGRLDRDAYLHAFALLVERHVILRTSYVSPGEAGAGPGACAGGGDELRQRVNDAAGFAVTVERVPGEEALAELLAAEQARPFHPGDRYQLRVHLLVLSEYEHVAALTRPWGVFDGWSTGVLLTELITAYRALSAGTRPDLPALPVGYQDFAAWQHQVVDAAALARQEEYWRGQLAGLAPCLPLRTDYRRGPGRSYRGGTVPVAVPAELATRLRRVSRELAASLYLTLLSAFALLVDEYRAGRADLAIGSPVSNRPHPDLERVAGYFVNVLALRLRVAEPDFPALLAQATRVSAQASEHKDIPFARVVRALRDEPDPAYPPLCQVMFNLVPAPTATESGDGELVVLPVPAPVTVARFDLNLTLQETPAGLHGYLEYSTDVFARPTADRMVRRYLRLLTAIAANPRTDLAQLRESTNRERDR